MIPKCWQFPEKPWTEYEAKDERWCRYFGIGQEVEVPTAYEVMEQDFLSFGSRPRKVVYASPMVIAAIKAQYPTPRSHP